MVHDHTALARMDLGFNPVGLFQRAHISLTS